MSIGLIADTQGSFDIAALLRHVAGEFAGVDEIWHAGDWGTEAVLDGLRQLGPHWSWSTATRRTIRTTR